jgi:hypothetical protein
MSEKIRKIQASPILTVTTKLETKQIRILKTHTLLKDGCKLGVAQLCTDGIERLGQNF